MANGYDETKTCQCVVCGKGVEVTKFATPSKVKCEECKNINSNVPQEDRPEQIVTWSDVRDVELRNICCLSCGEPMDLKVLVKSDQFGDVLTAQCPSCYLVIQLSEQNRKFRWKLKASALNHLAIREEATRCEDSSEVQQE